MEKIISFGQENEKLYKCISNMLEGQFDDYGAVTTILEKYVERVIFAIVRNEQLTEMLVGQAFTVIFNSLGELDNAKYFWRWCYRKTIGVAVEYISENGIDMQLDYYKDVVPEGIKFDYWYKDTETFIPGIVVMEPANLLQIWARLGNLTVGQQASMLYFYFAEMSVDEIAVLLNTTPKSVRRGIDFGRGIVKDMLEELYGKANLKKLSMSRLPIIQVVFHEVLYNIVDRNASDNGVIYDMDSGNFVGVEYQSGQSSINKNLSDSRVGNTSFFQAVAQTLLQSKQPREQQYIPQRSNYYIQPTTGFTEVPLANHTVGYTEAHLVNNVGGYTEAPLVSNAGGYTEAPLVSDAGRYTEAHIVNNVSNSNTLENIIESGYGIQGEHLRETDPEQYYTLNYKWFDLAAKAGNADAMNNLAYCFFFGYGTKKNYGLAISWYKKAAKAGNEYAIEYLKQLEEQGYIENN